MTFTLVFLVFLLAAQYVALALLWRRQARSIVTLGRCVQMIRRRHHQMAGVVNHNADTLIVLGEVVDELAEQQAHLNFVAVRSITELDDRTRRVEARLGLSPLDVPLSFTLSDPCPMAGEGGQP